MRCQPIAPPPGAAADGNSNARSSFPQTTTAPSRGALTTDFLAGSAEPLAYLGELARARGYMGVSVAAGDLRTGRAAFFCNRDGAAPRALAPGAYGVSNGRLNEWPKVTGGVAALRAILAEPGVAAAVAAGELPWGRLFGAEVMGDAAPVADPADVPLTGVGEELDAALSARFVMPFELMVGCCLSVCVCSCLS